MGVVDWLRRLVGGRTPVDRGIYYYVRCDKCGEKIRFRVDPLWDLSPVYEGEDQASGYVVTKRVVGQKCFRPIEVSLTFDRNRKESGRSVTGGHLISAEEFAAEEP
ncbi:MAG: hypothetical protein IRY83_07685 [Chloroflexi bacterium]|jgi:hypothetical protein|nr:hypothetical protein [Chloroflexota bacterium]HLG50334.1 hypothetical protein [Chloroflexota bacterium]